jgi:hypothetical protein
MKQFVTIVFLIGAAIRLYSQGYVIPNGVAFNSYDGLGYSVFVTQNPTNGDYTGFDLIPAGRTPPSSLYVNTFSFSPIVDEGVRTFIVSSNDAISLQPILSQSYTELLYPNSYVFRNGIPFYLGFYSGYTPWIITNGTSVYAGIYSRPVFGWGKFVNNQGVIEMLDSALEIEGGGIYAGTQIIIPSPEPSALALVVLGGLLLGFRRWSQ